MNSKRNRHLELVKAICREFRIEHEETDQPYIFIHMDDYRPVVEGLLRSRAWCRESDARLYYVFLQTIGENPQAMTAYELLRDIHRGVIPHWGAVSRLRWELQSAHPELRGKTWGVVANPEQELPFDEGQNE